MDHNQIIITVLAFSDCTRGRPEEQDFYETFGREPVVRPFLNYTLAAIRAVLHRLSQEARHLYVNSGTHSAP
jgi:hypothetical protein